MAFLSRVGRWLVEMLIAIDQLAHVLLGGPKYLIRGGPCPSADETISSKVGRQAIRGRRWAIVLEKVINLIFWFDCDPVTGHLNHCRNRIEIDELAADLRAEIDRLRRA